MFSLVTKIFFVFANCLQLLHGFSSISPWYIANIYPSSFLLVIISSREFDADLSQNSLFLLSNLVIYTKQFHMSFTMPHTSMKYIHHAALKCSIPLLVIWWVHTFDRLKVQQTIWFLMLFTSWSTFFPSISCEAEITIV